MVFTETTNILTGFWDEDGTGTIPDSSPEAQRSMLHKHLLHKSTKTSGFSYRTAQESVLS